MFADALIVGGGVQGLAVLRALSMAGQRALLVTASELGSGQTLHAHGLLDSGTGLLTGETRAELVDHVLPELARLGVPVRSDAPSCLALSPAMLEQVRPLWAARPDPPQRLGDGEMPSLRLSSPVHRVTAHHVSKTALVAALVAGLRDRVALGRLVDVGAPCHVQLIGRETTLSVDTRAVVVAAGCGTPRLLTETLGLGASLAARLGHLRTHMICLRAPGGVLPVIGTVMTPGLAIIAHQRGDGSSLWYVTPQVGQPERVAVVPDDGHADVDEELVSFGVNRLRDLVPALAEPDPQVQATVFAGYKQDVDGQITRRLVELIPGNPPVIVTVPSIYAGAWANAREVVQLVTALDPLRTTSAPVELGTRPVPIGTENEERADVHWAAWRDFARRLDQ